MCGEGTFTPRNRTSEPLDSLPSPFDTLPCGSSGNWNEVPECTWRTDPVSDAGNGDVVRGRGDTAAGNKNRGPKCTVRDDLTEVKCIGVLRGGGGNRNKDGIPNRIWGDGLLSRPRSRRLSYEIDDRESSGEVRDKDGAVFQRLGLTTDLVSNPLGRQGSYNIRRLEPLRAGKSLGTVYRNWVFSPYVPRSLQKQRPSPTMCYTCRRDVQLDCSYLVSIPIA